MSHPRKFRFALQLVAAPTGAQWVAMARQAEADGFSVLSMPDHLGDQFSPIPGLAAAAAVTSRIRLSMFVLCNDNRHPGLLAKEITTLDRLSDGRVELGIGAGWTKTEYDALGMAFDSPGIRIDRLAEAVAILRAAFTEERVNFTGRYYRITDLAVLPRPAQPAGLPRPAQPAGLPHPAYPSGIPIVLGGGGRKMLSLAARSADIVGIAANNGRRLRIDAPLGGFSLDAVREQVGWVREAAGDDFPARELNIRILAVGIGPDRRASAAAASQQMKIPIEDLLSSPFAMFGTLDGIAEQLERQRETLAVSYYTISQRHAAPLAPLITRLSGQ